MCFLVISFSNFKRKRKVSNGQYKLIPNCLLTRSPLLFLTGPRSLFYFTSYWNTYTAYLAEHGYEVFNLKLPWNNPEQRIQRFDQFLLEQEKNNNGFHLFLDSSTLEEFNQLLRHRNSPSILSLTEITSPGKECNLNQHHPFPYPFHSLKCSKNEHSDLLGLLAFTFHKLTLKKYKNLPTFETLGGCEKTALQNSKQLLARAIFLAEKEVCC
jgi:hypothetical protein